MTLVDLDGAETGVTFLPPSVGITGTPANTTGRDGVGNAYKGTTSTGQMTRVIAPGSDTIYWHQGIFIINGASVFGSTTSGTPFWSLQADGGLITHLSLNIDGAGHLILRRGLITGTIIATSTQAFSSTGAWYSVESKVTIHDTTGECVVKINGEIWINFTGDTKNAGTNTRLDTILAGCSSLLYQDDFLLNDTTGSVNNSWPGEISIVGVRPANNGANNGLTGSDANQVNNYQQVDEFPILSADYNGSATSLALDTYDMTAVGKLGNVLAVKLDQVAAKSDAGAKSFKHVQRGASAGLVKSSAVALTTTYIVYSGPIWTTDGDGNAWTVARVDAAEFGFEVQ